MLHLSVASLLSYISIFYYLVYASEGRGQLACPNTVGLRCICNCNSVAIIINGHSAKVSHET